MRCGKEKECVNYTTSFFSKNGNLYRFPWHYAKCSELRAETRRECSLGWQQMISKIKNVRSAKPAARRGPKPVKNAIFEAIRKKRKIEKIASKLVGITRRMLPKGFFGHQGAPLGGVLPPYRKSLLFTVGNFKLKKSISISLDFA